MYFGIKWTNSEEFNSSREYLVSFKEFETTKYSHVFKFDLKDLRKLKILSLHNEDIKKNLAKLQTFLNDESKVVMYGDKMPNFESGTTGSSGSSGTSGSSGISGISKINNLKMEIETVKPYVKPVNPFLSMINEIFDAEYLTEEINI